MKMGEVVVNVGDDMEVVKNETYMVDEDSGGGGGGGEVVSWESYLPKMVLRVLLVEADDSTRQIIAALLRKCKYRVVAVDDGLKAWEVIKGRHHKIDLILTETELPSISGFALLTLVMEHDMCKNIPVIMMSSQDSVHMVLKCMLKGAADYLIKPVRRNELRNLWQHVWRRLTIGGKGLPNLTIPQPKVEVTSNNNATSKLGKGCTASMWQTKECSEKGSEAQSSCTMPYLKAESAYMQNMQDNSQLKYGSASNLSNTDMERHEECARPEKESVMHESERKEKSGTFGSDVVPLNEGHTSTALRDDHVSAMKRVQDEDIQPESCKGNANIASETHSCLYGLDEPSSGTIDFIGTFDNQLKCTVGRPDNRDDDTSTPQLELSLRSCSGSSKKQESDKRPLLNHSNSSAFSWYNNSKTLQPLFPTFPSTKSDGECKSDDSQENASTLVSGQTEQADLSFPGPQLGMIPVTGVTSDFIRAGYDHFFPSLFLRKPDVTPTCSTKSVCQGAQSPIPVGSSNHSNPEIHHLEKGCHLADKTTYKSIDQTVHKQNKLECMEELRPGSPATGQSACSSLDNAVGNHIGSSAYGSICGSNDGNATLAVVGERSTASESLNDSGRSVHEGFGGADCLRTSQREAALTKFRLKRKDRCFEKKVRYQRRKLLAEQRPRVKGQFVHRTQTDSPTAHAVGS